MSGRPAPLRAPPRAPRAPRTPPTPRAPLAGFTLVELCVVCTMAGLLAVMAWPSWSNHLAQARRTDGVQALARVQAAQESYRSHHGLYATDLAVLQGATQARSAEGHYLLQLERTAAEAYRATAVAQGRQASDTDCAVLTLEVRQGFANHGPSMRCWNR